MNVQVSLRVAWSSGLLFLFVLLISASVSADTNMQEVKIWLARMHDAMQHQDYAGVLVYERGVTLSTLKLYHRFKEGKEQERWIQMDGERGEVLRDGDAISCILPGNKLVELGNAFGDRPLSIQFEKKMMPNPAYYIMQLAGEDRVAGRMTQKIALMAKDANRYHYLLWLDRKTGLLVKYRLMNAEGQVLEGFQFTSLQLPAKVTDDELKPQFKGALVRHKQVPMVHRDKNSSDDIIWKIGWLPAGFDLLEGVNGKLLDNHRLQGGNVQMYSDGLASFSLFVEKTGRWNMPEGATQIGGTVAFVHRIHDDKVDYTVTVIGDIPVKTAQEITMSLSPVL
jgi:sigma-E factor negative regulatory protein RseB